MYIKETFKIFYIKTFDFEETKTCQKEGTYLFLSETQGEKGDGSMFNSDCNNVPVTTFQSLPTGHPRILRTLKRPNSSVKTSLRDDLWKDPEIPINKGTR